MILLRIILLPFSLIYLMLTRFRNHLFDIGYTPSFRFETFVIGVGNLRVGGTGKTPHVEYLIRLLKEKYKVATLSRGYGRKTKGIIFADHHSTAKTIGDEPFQFYTKFSKDITVVVGEARALAIPTILFEKPDTNIIILDDAFQHRSVVPDINILLTDINDPFYADWVLPSGRLRESRRGARRADAVIVTKCQEALGTSVQSDVLNKIHKYTSPGTPVFFTGIKYREPIPLDPVMKGGMPENVMLVTGIANPAPLIQEVERRYSVGKVLIYNDHHQYTEKTILSILKQFEEMEGNPKVIVTTEKDMVKWVSDPIKNIFNGIPVFYIPIEIFFLDGKERFDQLISDSIQKKSLL